MEGKVAIVTGGTGGIGSATARHLAQDGASVVIADIAATAAAEVAETIGAQAVGRGFDAESIGSIEELVAFAVRHFGRLDILHNNAGYVGADLALDTNVTDIPLALWEKTMGINLRGYFADARFAIPHMMRGGGGPIINTASGSPFVGDLARVAYGTSKGAVRSGSVNRRILRPWSPIWHRMMPPM